MQEVSGVYTFPFLYTDGLKMALRAWKVSGAFEKRPPVARFSKAPETSRAHKAIAKSRIWWLQSYCIHIFLIWREVHFTQEVSGVYLSPFLDTDELKMALRARNVFGAFEKRAPE